MNSASQENGSAIVECAIALPVFLFLSMIIIDMGRYLDRLYLVSRISYEASRYAASLADIEEGTNLYLTDATVQGQVRLRVNTLLRGFGLETQQGIETNDAALQAATGDQIARILDITVQRAAGEDNKITVEVEVPFYPVFTGAGPGLQMTKLSSIKYRSTVPFLFARPDSQTYRRE